MAPVAIAGAQKVPGTFKLIALINEIYDTAFGKFGGKFFEYLLEKWAWSVAGCTECAEIENSEINLQFQ